MPRRKPEPAPKRKAARKSAPTKAQRQEFADAANSAARAALAPLTAQMEKLSRQITAQQSLVLKDIAAAVRAAAEAQTEYALVLPTPAHALIARNAEHAAEAYPADHTYTPKPYLSQRGRESESASVPTPCIQPPVRCAGGGVFLFRWVCPVVPTAAILPLLPYPPL